jgi:hypothetical protein
MLFVRLQLWDIGSQIKSLQMAANYLQGCDAIIIVHDLTNQEVRQGLRQAPTLTVLLLAALPAQPQHTLLPLQLHPLHLICASACW